MNVRSFVSDVYRRVGEKSKKSVTSARLFHSIFFNQLTTDIDFCIFMGSFALPQIAGDHKSRSTVKIQIRASKTVMRSVRGRSLTEASLSNIFVFYRLQEDVEDEDVLASRRDSESDFYAVLNHRIRPNDVASAAALLSNH